MALLEIACFNAESAIIAARAGAQRIELCADYSAGGITPAVEDFLKVKNAINIPVYIMIRPRGGNFVYSEEDIKTLNSQLSTFKLLDVSGFVFGCLTPDNKIDIELNFSLVKLAHPIPCTFHRAFDATPDLFQSLQQLITCGFTRVLTSGGKGGAENNLPVLKELIKQSENKITVIPGGGIRSTNVKKIIEQTGCKEVHSAALLPGERVVDEGEVLKLNEELKIKN